MASPIFHKLHAARRNPGLFDHINQNNDHAGPTKIYNTIENFAKRGLYLTLRCNQCHISGTPNGPKNIPIRDITFTCPHCNNTALEQDLGPKIQQQQQHIFIGLKKITPINAETDMDTNITPTSTPPTTKKSTTKRKAHPRTDPIDID